MGWKKPLSQMGLAFQSQNLILLFQSDVAEVHTEFQFSFLEGKGTIPKCMLLCFSFPYVLVFGQLQA